MTVMIGRCEGYAENPSNCPQYYIIKHASNELAEMARTVTHR